MRDTLRPARSFAPAVLLGVALAACARAPAPAEPEPRPAAAAALDPLEATDAMLRVADRTEPTGEELGRMWLFENPPLGRWAQVYGFEPSAQWLERVRLAALRFGEGCSASFVSGDGLIMTNHHCARECVDQLSTERRDYILEGFYAPTRADEQVCPELYVDQLASTDDVTERVQAEAAAAADDEAAADAREDVVEAIETECEEATALSCEVVELYHGARYHLYRYRRHQPVKLVFAPEKQAAHFGGELDNFTYPRYALDVAFLRAYDDGGATPARTPQHFGWDADGAAENELILIPGNPGSTNRLRTVEQLLYYGRYQHPFLVGYWRDVVELWRLLASLSPEAELAVREDLATYENQLKRLEGELKALNDSTVLGRKIAWERALRARVEADPELRTEYGDVWDAVAALQRERIAIEPRQTVYSFEFIGDPYLAIAGDLVRWIRESAKPPEQRLEDWTQERLDSVRAELVEQLPVSPEFAARLLLIRLHAAQRALPPDDPFLREALGPGGTPMAGARRIAQRSRILDASFRRELIEGGVEALAASSDPAVRLALLMDDALRELDPRMDALDARTTTQEARLARAQFAVFGDDIPPDATFTPRITDGIVAGYEYNGTVAPPFTSFYGVYGRANNFGGEPPFDLPPSYVRRRQHVDLGAYLDFVSTGDTTGGNSGSAIIDRDAEVVGVLFDGNIESFQTDFVYTTEGARAVGVHSAGILEALRNIYGAGALIAELTGGR